MVTMTDVDSGWGVLLGPFFEAMGLTPGVMRPPQYREYIKGG